MKLQSALAVLLVASHLIADDAPKSADASRARLDYDKANANAKVAYERAIGQARTEYVRSLKTSMDKALERKDLDEANRIKAEMEQTESEAAADGKLDAKSILGTTWIRFNRTGGLASVMTFKPQGVLDATLTGYKTWRMQGDSVVLAGHPDRESRQFVALQAELLVPRGQELGADEDSFVLVRRRR